jgi:hypothetical protein
LHRVILGRNHNKTWRLLVYTLAANANHILGEGLNAAIGGLPTRPAGWPEFYHYHSRRNVGVPCRWVSRVVGVPCRCSARPRAVPSTSTRRAPARPGGSTSVADAYRAPDEPDLDDDAAWKSLMQQLHQQDWVVHIEAPFADPEPLIRYLGRYVNRIAIANHRIEAIDGGRVTFRYRDNRIKDPHAPEAEKRMTLSGADFIHRFLQHVLPPSFHRIRYYGLLGGSRRRQNLTRCRECLGLADPETPYIPDMDAFLAKQARDPSLCPVCGKGHLHNILHVLSFEEPPAPFNAPPPSRAPPLPAPAALPEAA